MEILRVWDKNSLDKYALCRIPGIIITSKGTLIIYNEARNSLSDWSEMDIFARRSEDGGKSFSEPIYLAYGTEKHPTVNNPVMAEDKNGNIHFLYCESYGTDGGRVLHRISRDDGLTWSVPEDITQATLPEERNVFALGPGHGICTSSGKLVFPFWLVPKRFGAPVRAHMPSEVGVLSSDYGITWQASKLLQNSADILSPNETVAAELSDGSIYLAIRHNAYYRASAKTHDCMNFTDYGAEYELPDPICFGSAVSLGDVLLFVNCAEQRKRASLTLSKSLDSGKTWSVCKVIDTSRGGYADIAASNGKIYIIYENGYGEELYLATLNESEI